MKKCLFIILLIIINCMLLYTKIYSNDLKNIKLKLNKDELAIIIIHIEDSTSLLLKRDDIFILYVLDYKSDNNLYTNIELFTKDIDYVFMNEEYDLKYPNKMVIDGSILLDEIRIEQSKIYHNGKTFCINSNKNCDYVYIFNEIVFNETPEILLYNQNLSSKYIENIHKMWIDTYKITTKEYTILILGNSYEVIKLQHEY